MSDRATAVIAAVVAAFLGMFFTRYMVSGHTELLVEVLIAQFIGNGLLVAPKYFPCIRGVSPSAV